MKCLISSTKSRFFWHCLLSVRASVPRCSKILPPRYNLSLWDFFERFLVFGTYVGIFILLGKLFIVAKGQILNKLSSNLVTLNHLEQISFSALVPGCIDSWSFPSNFCIGRWCRRPEMPDTRSRHPSTLKRVRYDFTPIHTRLLGQSRFKPCLWPGYFLLQSLDCM